MTTSPEEPVTHPVAQPVAHPIERRGAPRMRPKGTVVVRGASRPIRGRIRNLSASGICFVIGGEARELVAELTDRPIDLELRLDTPTSSWTSLRGRIVRHDGDHIAAALTANAGAFDAIIASELARSLDNGHTPLVVVVDGQPARRAPIADAFRGAGYVTLEVATPLEAIVCVGEAGYEPHLIAVSDTLPEAIGDELRAFLECEHPRTQIVTIGHGPLQVPVSALPDWLASSDLQNDLDQRVRRLLGRVRR